MCHGAACLHVLVVQVHASALRPYHLKTEGVERGTYVRLGSINRRADAALIAELARRIDIESYDERPLLSIRRSRMYDMVLCLVTCRHVFHDEPDMHVRLHLYRVENFATSRSPSDWSGWTRTSPAVEFWASRGERGRGKSNE